MSWSNLRFLYRTRGFAKKQFTVDVFEEIMGIIRIRCDNGHYAAVRN
jgi:hypothetical protein